MNKRSKILKIFTIPMVIFLVSGALFIFVLATFQLDWKNYQGQHKLRESYIVDLEHALGFNGLSSCYLTLGNLSEEMFKQRCLDSASVAINAVQKYRLTGSLSKVESRSLFLLEEFIGLYRRDLKRLAQKPGKQNQNLARARLTETSEKVFVALANLRADNAQVIRQSEAELTDSSVLLIILICTAFPVTLVTLLFVIFYLYRNVASPIDETNQALDKMAEGDLSFEIEVDTAFAEISTLKKHVKASIANLRNLVRELLASRSEAMEIAVEAGRKAKDVLNSSQEQAALLEEAAAAVEELSASTQNISDAAQKQLDGAASNLSSMKDLQDLFVKSGEIQEQITSEAQQTMDKAQAGGYAVELSVSSMEEIVETSQKVLGIIDVINDIADQTDLLALNASIEAARAGEHGKGFAVVAHEISELAEKSSASAKEIARLLRTANQTVETGTEHVQSTKNIFLKIIDSMQKLVQDIASVRQMDEQQSRAVNETADRANNVSLLAQEIADATRLQNQSSEEITEDMSRANEITASNVEQIEFLDQRLGSLSRAMQDGLVFVNKFKLTS